MKTLREDSPLPAGNCRRTGRRSPATTGSGEERSAILLLEQPPANQQQPGREIFKVTAARIARVLCPLKFSELYIYIYFLVSR